MKEEDFIRKKYGSGNPFKVPEGYFEQFTSELMSKLPEKEMKPVLSMPSRRRRRAEHGRDLEGRPCGRRPVRCHVSRNILSPIRNSPPR